MLNIVALSWRFMKHDNTVKTLRSPLKENFLTLFSPDCSILGEYNYCEFTFANVGVQTIQGPEGSRMGIKR